jgi:hypothetical protein
MALTGKWSNRQSSKPSRNWRPDLNRFVIVEECLTGYICNQTFCCKSEKSLASASKSITGKSYTSFSFHLTFLCLLLLVSSLVFSNLALSNSAFGAASVSEQTFDEIIFIDSAVSDQTLLIESLQRNVEVIYLPSDHDGLTYISKILEGRSGITAVHLVSHGEPGAVMLGQTMINSDSLTGYKYELLTLKNALSPDADILLYGCNISQDEIGKNFLTDLQAMTNADIAASDNLTGGIAQGGDWVLESKRGEVQTASIFDNQSIKNYSGLLAAGVANIDGIEKQGETLTVSVVDDDGTTTTIDFSYQWKRNGTDISGANAQTLILTQTDVGTNITVTVSYTDDLSNPENITSAPTGAIANVNDAPTGSVTIDGSAVEDQILTAQTGSINDADGLGTFSYQWKSAGSNVGSNSSSYQLQQSDVGNTLTVTVTYNDGGSTIESLTSASTATVINVNDPPTGSLTISGSPEQGNILAADTSAINDEDGLGGFNYKWFSDGAEISGAIASTYTLQQADVGNRIKVSVTYLDGFGTTETLTSAQTSIVTDVNDPPVGVPTISGTSTQGQTLTASTSAITDTDGLGSFSYQWQRGGNNINNATSSTYKLVQADVDQFISIRVRYTDGGNTLETVFSSQTSAIANVNDAPVGKPTISGTTAEGSVLSVITTGISDADGLGNFNYQWRRNGADVGGATGDTFALTQTDVGSKFSVEVKYTDDYGFQESVVSNQTATITNVNDPPVGQPTINGNATQGQTLTADASGITDADGPGTLTFSYQWLRSGSTINDATAISYKLVQADVGKQMSVRASYIDGGNKSESVTSVPTAAVANINDAPVGLPTISGNLLEGNQLTAVTSDISDIDGLGAFSYQWLRNSGVIDGATSKTFLLTQTDVNSRLSVTVRYQDGGLTVETLTSAQTAPIANANNSPTGKPVINGSVTEGGLLTADTTGISDTDGLGSFSYQWLRNNGVINGATAKSYTLIQADVGKRIRVSVNYVDGGNTPESVTSDQTVAVTNINDAPVGLPTISGSTVQGSLLTANTNGISDTDGLGTFKYQWLRNSNIIDGANSQQYRTVQADVGMNMSVRVTYTDGGLTIESITSAQTSAITDVNDAPVGAPVIIGNATQGNVLTADISAISDADGLGVFSYQWLRNNAPIPGATATTYELLQADVGTAIKIRVSYIDGGLTKEIVVSNELGPIINVNDSPVGLPVITGSPTQGVTLVSSVAGISDLDGLGALSYQWLRDGDKITGATSTTYTLVQADVGTLISLRISFKDGGGQNETVTSVQTTAVINVNDLPVGLPLIIGDVIQGSILTADTSGISDEDGFGEAGFNYQWLRNGVAIIDANASSYTLVQEDVLTLISVLVSYTDAANALESVTSAETIPVVNVNDLPVGVPIITGALTQGEVLTAITSEITDIDGLGEFAYQWLRDGTEIIDATTITYTLVQADVDTFISIRISYIDGGLTEEILVSNELGPIININDTGTVTIVGEATVAADIPLTVGEIIDIDGTTTSNFIYQWFRGNPNSSGLCVDTVAGTAISGATSDTYGLTNNDLRMCITLRVIYTDDFGENELIFSNIKGPIFPDVPKVTAPAGIGPVNSTGWFTFVDLEQSTKASARDGLDGVLSPVADSNGQLRPGTNTVTWSATDSAGNVGIATQVVKVIPIAEVSRLATAAEGSEAQFIVSLNGDALQYPVVIPYSVNGTAANDGSDHSLCLTSVSASNCVIANPALQASILEADNGTVAIAFNVINDGVPEGTENIVITLGTPQNAVLGINTVHTIEVLEGNVPPRVSLEASQVQFDSSSDTVTAFALATDANDADVLSYDWSRSDNAIPSINNTSDAIFFIEPVDLAPGIYTLQVDVDDGQATASDSLVLYVLEELLELNASIDTDGDGIDDVAEGYMDSDGDGIADYLDAITTGNVIQILPAVSDAFIMQTEPGLRLKLADISFSANKGSTLVDENDVVAFVNGSSTNIDTSDVDGTSTLLDTIENIGGYFDFTVTELPMAGQVINVVIPQLTEMPRVPVYRKLTASGWKDFVENSKNSVSSAAGVRGYCPPPGSAEYQPGLKKGHWCLQLTIEDGGPNDSDGKANHRITDPGGVGRILSSITISSGGGGGGSLNPYVALMIFFGLLSIRNIKRRR